MINTIIEQIKAIEDPDTLVFEYQLDQQQVYIYLDTDNDTHDIAFIKHTSIYTYLKQLSKLNIDIIICDMTSDNTYHEDTKANTLKEYAKHFDNNYGQSRPWKVRGQ